MKWKRKKCVHKIDGVSVSIRTREAHTPSVCTQIIIAIEN